MNILETHEKIRQILIDSGSEEYGDCIIDEICQAVNYPTTVDFEAMIKDNNISFDDFYNVLRDLDEGDWDSINSEATIKQYVSEKMREGITVSHILQAIESNPSKEELYYIWLGNSMETPLPINTKQDLYDFLDIKN